VLLLLDQLLGPQLQLLLLLLLRLLRLRLRRTFASFALSTP
jgi:hypothetical protein